MKHYHLNKKATRSCVSFIIIFLVFSSQCNAGNLTPRMKLMAKRAAKVDALRNLSEIVYGLQLDTSSTVQNFVLKSDTIRSRLTVAIQRAREVAYQQLEDGTAEVTMEITLGTVETILGRRLQYDQEMIEAVGYGVPSDIGRTQNPLPPGGTVTATGYGLAPDERGLSSVESDLLGFRAAKNAALRNLAEKIKQIRITAQSTVRDYSVQSDTVRVRVNSVLDGARVISKKRLADSRYEVILETNISPLLDL